MNGIKREFRRFIFPALAVALLTPWPVAYAYDNSAAAAAAPAQVEAAGPQDMPGWTTFGNAIGGVSKPGDLFYIDFTDTAADTPVSLYITNAEELVHHYRYLILKVGIYVQTGADQWQEAVAPDGAALTDTYITMRNGRLSFILPGYARYKITIDGGSFYCYQSGDNTGSASPKFYLTVE
ncbi:MAG: hypothetical protein V1691_03660 [Chloroflexota bacterium]